MKIGFLHINNNLLLAPMAGITDLPYRRIMKGFGAGLVFTEMVSANGLIRAGRRTRELVRSSPEERPLGIQLFGSDPEVLAEALDLVLDDGELFDLNLGCPVHKVVRSGAGSAMLRDPKQVARAVAAMRKRTGKPLTVKIRSGWDAGSINYLEVGRIAEAEGADAVTLHPRTRSQGFGGQADWDQIRRLKECLTIPVIGSGDIATADDAIAMQTASGCDAVMIGRGSYGNPWLFRDILAKRDGNAHVPPTAQERLEVVRRHLAYFVETFGPPKAMRDMRKHLCWYSRGLDGAASFRTSVNKIKDFTELEEAVNILFGKSPPPDALS
ncbi:MAG TPA: tRNA dihydrouridine synthase DusB [Desulfuromonadales bacterium]|nr:tRNA dihydrouridine synthase DusB [Desulfuromonadales bacterium]